MQLNALLETPNGRGLYQGPMYENGQHYLLVRHPKPVEQPKGGIPATKTSRTLWLYTVEEVRQ